MCGRQALPELTARITQGKGSRSRVHGHLNIKEVESKTGIQCIVVLRAKEFVNKYLIKLKFMKEFYGRFKKKDIKIPHPGRKIYLQKEQRIQ